MPRLKRKPLRTSGGKQDQGAKIALLQKALRACEAKVAELTLRVERQRTILRNRRFAQAKIANHLKGHMALTLREREVLWAFLEHCSDQKVAAHLGTSTQTVRNQMTSILLKLGVETRAELVITV